MSKLRLLKSGRLVREITELQGLDGTPLPDERILEATTQLRFSFKLPGRKFFSLALAGKAAVFHLTDGHMMIPISIALVLLIPEGIKALAVVNPERVLTAPAS